MNLPGDRCHHVEIGFCRLVLPLGNTRWLVFADGMKGTVVGRGFHVVSGRRWHNARTDGVKRWTCAHCGNDQQFRWNECADCKRKN